MKFFTEFQVRAVIEDLIMSFYILQIYFFVFNVYHEELD